MDTALCRQNSGLQDSSNGKVMTALISENLLTFESSHVKCIFCTHIKFPPQSRLLVFLPLSSVVSFLFFLLSFLSGKLSAFNQTSRPRQFTSYERKPESEIRTAPELENVGGAFRLFPRLQRARANYYHIS